MISFVPKNVLLLALAVVSCIAADPAFLRADPDVGRRLVSCSEQCTTQGSCASGQINVCHEGKENECIASAEWNEHCTNFGDTCGACATSATSGTGCFPATSMLTVLGKGPVSMEEAQLGDMVLTSAQHYEPIYAFGHYSPDAKADFLKIKTTVDTLELTGEHLLNVAGKEYPVRADSIKVGDALFALEGEARVLKIHTVDNKGLYAPLTPSGKMVVNGVVASSYIALTRDSERISIGQWSMAHGDFVHLTLAPLRVFCMGVTDTPCQVYDEDGISLYISWGMAIVEAAHNEGAFWGYLCLAIGMPIAAFFLAIEFLFGPSFALLAVFALGVGASFYRKSRAGKVKTA